MGVRDMIAYAADQYGADRGLLDSVARLESGYRTNVQNNLDSNAKAGIPSYGLFQFVQPTFASFAREAAKAKPGLWARYNGNFDYRDPRQQALAAAWGFANGKASHWSTSDRARSAANEYNYQPKWRMGGVQGATTQPAVNPQQLAAVKADFDKAIQFGQQQVKDATQRVGRFDALTDEQKQQLNYRYGAREAQNMDMRQRSAMAQGLTAAQQNVADMRSGAKADLAGAQANLTKLQQQREQTIDKLANMQLPDPSSELGRMSNGIRSQLVATARQEVGTVAAQAMKYIRASGGTGYEAWCFAAGTLVDTPDGMRRIEDLSVGDAVYDGGGNVESVAAVFGRRADTVRITALGLDGTKVSRNHPYLVRRRLTEVGQPRRFSEPEWVFAEDIRRNDLIALTQPILRRNFEDEPTAAEAMLIGRWLADGWHVTGTQRDGRHKRDQWSLCCGHHEVDAVRQLLDRSGVGYSERRSRTTTDFRIANANARRLFAGFGSGCHSKRIPGRVFTWGRASWMNLLMGYVMGDGCLTSGGQVFKANSVNRELIYGIAKIARLIGFVVRINSYERAETTVIEGRVVNQSPVRYEIAWSPSSQQVVDDGDVTWVPVRSVEDSGEDTVYNLTVTGTHTYVADGVIVHNCGDFVRYVFKQNGLTPPPARYVPDLLKWAQGNDTLRKTGRAGDLAMFDWNNDGVPDHVELVTGGRGVGRYQTIGGNTSGNRGSSQVAQKLRTGNILGFVDVLSALGVKA